MAEGALKRSPADLAGAVTGVAGPEPDEDGNPVDASVSPSRGGDMRSLKELCNIGRDAMRGHAIADALSELIRMVDKT
jgi:nicotinamide mononucleotide (NMN) deamidase PncC